MDNYRSLTIGIKDTFGEKVDIVEKSPVSGGDINDSYVLTLSDGNRVFMKSNSAKNSAFFDAEEKGLKAISETGAIGTPKVLFRGTDLDAGTTFLVIEYLFCTDRIPDFWEEFGHSLAAMHLADTKSFVSEGRYGFDYDNYIGATKQINTCKDSWQDFFRECRLIPQFRMAESYFSDGDRKNIERLLDRVPELMPEPDRPSLLHGDLWSGNYIAGNDGRAWLIDPAVYVGNSEADLAMTELFGRFPQSFYDAYSEVNRIDSGYRERRDFYNLYHLLNHLNLFGPGYLPSVLSVINHYVG